MKIGCCARPEEISLVKEAGFDYVELAGKTLASMEESRFKALVDKLGSLDLPCWNLNACCPPQIHMAGPLYHREINRAYLQKLASRASVLGIRCVCVGSPMSRILPEGFDRKLAEEQLVAFLVDMTEVFSPIGVRIGFEPLGTCYCNFFNYMEETPPLLAHFPRELVGLTVDFYNLEHSQEADRPLDAYLPRIFHVHISDDAGSPSQRDFLIPGKYPIHQARLRRLIDSGYHGSVSIEIDKPVRLPEATVSLQLLRKACVSDAASCG